MRIPDQSRSPIKAEDRVQVERRTITDREQWLAWRKADVTASVVGALFECHPYATALRLYVEKRGVEFLEPDNSVMRRGRWLEPAVAKAVNELRPEWELQAPNEYLRDAELKLGATPDFYIHGDPRGLGVLQCKTCAPSVYAREWLDGSEIPFWITLQTLTECMLSGASFGAVAVMLVDPHNMDVKILDVPRHAAAEAKIVAAVKQFWQQVEAGIEPQPDFARDAALIRALSPRATEGATIDLSSNNRIRELLAIRAEHKAELKAAQELCDIIEAEIRFIMGDAQEAVGIDGWRILYKNRLVKEHVVPEKWQRPLMIYDKRAKE